MSLIRIQRDPSPRQLRGFGLVWLLFFGAVAYLLWRRTGSAAAGGAVAALAALVPAAGLFWPEVLRWAFLGLSWAAFPIGFVVSHLVLALVYFVVLTPIGLAMRLAGRDPMHRRFEPEAESYWVRHEKPESSDRYLRQF